MSRASCTRRMLVPIAGALLAGAAPPAADAAVCEVFRRPIPFATDAEVQMIVLSGRDCRVKFQPDEVFPVERIHLTGRPLYGGARVEGGATAYYRSNPGYRGPDRFSFALCGSERGQTGCSNVLVKVRVR